MLLFASDIDNTLIYSHKKENIGSKIPCELYNGENISFITEYTKENLEIVHNNALFVPVTTRSIEQYNRIKFGDFIPNYALTSNGGNLLIKGKVDNSWYSQTVALCQHAFDSLTKGEEFLEKDSNRTLEVKRVDGLFTYTKSAAPQETVSKLQKLLHNEPVNVHYYGNKVYILPDNLNKGSALKRFINEYLDNIDKIITAGDSVFDIPLLNAGDLAVFPSNLEFSPSNNYLKINNNNFSDELLKEVIKHL